MTVPLRQRLTWPVVTCAATAVSALLPLAASTSFYSRGDTAAQFVPTWYHLGQLVSHGHWPPVMDPGGWAGGNYAAEALHGVYNPINVLIWLFTYVMPDTLVAVTVVKVVTMVLLALGVHLLAREYGARPWAASVVGVAVPMTGYTLFWDAGSWASGLIAFAYFPWVWLTLRKTARGSLSPAWAFVVGALAILNGNPYGTLGVVFAGLAVLLEAALARDWKGVTRAGLTGLAIAAFLPMVYLPLLGTVQLAYRVSGPAIGNNGKLTGSWTDLFMLGSPGYMPDIRAIVGKMAVPSAYFAWFFVPLLPWVLWPPKEIRATWWRGRAGLVLVTVCYLLLVIGPSKIWFFRWPVRVIEYGYLGLAVLFAVLLSRGLRRDNAGSRLTVSVALTMLTVTLTTGQTLHYPLGMLAQGLLLGVLSVAVAVLLGTHLLAPRIARGRTSADAVLAAVMIGGTLLVTGAMTQAFGENQSSRVWHFPSNVSAIRHDFSGLHGTVLQLADVRRLETVPHDARLRESWRHLLAGSMFDVAGVDAVNHYSGMGYQSFVKHLCMAYDGMAKPCGYVKVQQPVAPGQPRLLDLMKIQTLVVGSGSAARGPVPAGFHLVSRNTDAVVLERTAPLAYPGSRLAWTSAGLTATNAQDRGLTGQSVHVSGAGTAVFAQLAWPGTTASLDGHALRVEPDRAGLLTVRVPPGSNGTLTLGFAPPGHLLGLLAAFVGVLLAAGLTAWARLGSITIRGRRPVL